MAEAKPKDKNTKPKKVRKKRVIRKPSKTSRSLKMGMKDERVPKLFGLFLLLVSLYLFIAFTSYLFTWEADFDRVQRFSWGLLFQTDLDIENWLGRLGAIVSHNFFWWLFGLSSYLFIPLLSLTGIFLIRRMQLSSLGIFYQNIGYSILWLSIFFAFIFKVYDFPFGGNFGKTISDWLSNFLGTIGMSFFFLFTLAVAIVWSFNPNFNEWTLDKILLKIGEFIQNLLPGGRKRKSMDPPTEDVDSVKVSPTKTLRPSNVKPAVKAVLKEGSQLAFDLNKKTTREKPQSLKKGEGELEIVKPTEENQTPELDLKDPIQQKKLTIQDENKQHLEPYDPTLELSSYQKPILELLEDYSDQKHEVDRAELETNKDQIIETLLNYKIEIIKIKATVGPTVTLYEIIPAPGIRISKIKNLEDDIALSLAALGIRIIAPIPGRGTIGIEVPNKNKRIVSLKEVLISDRFKHAKMDLPIALGKNISDEVIVVDLAKMPHLLIAGATGQGKSVGINTVLMSLLYKKHPSQVKLILIDPKKVELFPYSTLENHFLGYLPGEDEPIVTETSKVVNTLNSLCIEMDSRYDLLKKAHTRNLKEYNNKFVGRRLNPEKGHKFLPYIVLVIDEFADMIMTAGKEVELPIGRLAQLARAVGIHLIIATQRPSVNIITGVIKANFPARIAYKVASRIDSRTILDSGGADQLIGRGDMLLSVGGDTIRLQCAFVDTPEVERVLEFIGNQKGYPEPFFLPEFGSDEQEFGITSIKFSEVDDMFKDAAHLVVINQQGSTSMLQRRLKLGYNRAGRIMDQLEAFGIVGQNEGSKAREVLFYDEKELLSFLNQLAKNNASGR